MGVRCKHRGEQREGNTNNRRCGCSAKGSERLKTLLEGKTIFTKSLD